MEKRYIGDLEVSEIGMGCMGFSHGYGKIPEVDYSIQAIQKGYDLGCTFFGTAEVYGMQTRWLGHNEEIVGQAVRPFRNKVVLATKIHPSTERLAQGERLDQVIRSHLEASMKRLQTDYVDLYYLHRIDEKIPVEDVAQVMGTLIKEGLIRGWGLSQVDVDTLASAHQITPVTAVQNIYSIVERDCEKAIFPYCLENHIGVVPFSPIASGFLSGKVTVDTAYEKVDDVRVWVPQLTKENIAANQPILEVLQRFAHQKDATSAQLSLAWMLHKYPNCVPIPGSKNQERIIENLGACHVKLTTEEFHQLEAALNTCEVHGHRGHVESMGKRWGEKK